MEPAKRTKLTVQFPRDASRWNPDNVELPVEVRRSDSALVGRTLASGSLDVGPGSYVARAVAPGGEFSGSIEVPAGLAEARVHLRFYDQAGSRSVGNSLGNSVAKAYGSLEDAPAAKPAEPAHFDLLQGHLLEGRPLTPAGAAQRDANGRMRAGAASGSMVLRVSCRSGGATLIAPIPESAAAHLAWEDASSDERPDAAFHFDHPQAELLLSYIRTNAIADAQLAAHSATLTATQLLRGKKWDPLAGALGAYVLLRLGSDDAGLNAELELRSKQLWRYNPTFPDAWCIRAECRARAGEHQAALETLLELKDRGLPLFSDGLRIAGLLLDAYLKPAALPGLDANLRRQATVLLRRLRWLGLHALPGEPILKLSNFDPANAEQYQQFWQSTEI